MVEGQAHSDEYMKIRERVETEWPSWKIQYYNQNIAISKHAKKLVHQERSQ